MPADWAEAVSCERSLGLGGISKRVRARNLEIEWGEARATGTFGGFWRARCSNLLVMGFHSTWRMGVLWKVDWLMIAKVVGNNGRDDSDGISEGGRDCQAPKLQAKDIVGKVWSMFGAWSAYCNMRDATYEGCDV